MNKYITWIKANRLTAGLIAGIILVFLVGGIFLKNYYANKQAILAEDLPEMDITFDANGPYAIISPRRDGNALLLNIKRVSSYDSISYELAYTSEGIDRGVVGNLDTKEKKAEYSQDILFGTCSKNVCKYDTGVENGTLTLHIKKANQPYRMLIQWHLQQPDLALGKLTSADNHFSYQLETVSAKPVVKSANKVISGGEQAVGSDDLSLLGFTIINELTGVPKLPDGKDIVGKVYAINTPLAKTLTAGVVSIELASQPASGDAIYRYDDSQNAWSQLDTKVSSSTLTTNSDKAGIFAVLASK